MTYKDLLKELKNLSDSQLNDEVVIYRTVSDYYTQLYGVGVAESGGGQLEIVTDNGLSLNSGQVVLVT